MGEQSGPPPIDFRSASQTAVQGPGSSSVTQLNLKPGKYALLCFVSDRQGGPPHVAKGMLAEANIR